MSQSRNNLAYRRSPSLDRFGRPPYALVRKIDGRHSIAGGLYEAALTIRYDSPNTVYQRLSGLAYLFTWSESIGGDVEYRFLSGFSMPPNHISTFAYWLEERLSEANRMSSTKRRTFNSVLDAVQSAERWFVAHGHHCPDPSMRAIEIDSVVSAQALQWDRHKRRVGEVREAPDLSDDDLACIEGYLYNFLKVPEPTHSDIRTSYVAPNYRIWTAYR